MSERYGALDELPEVLEGLEAHILETLASIRTNLRRNERSALGDPRFDAGRMSALRDVLDYLNVPEGQ